MYTYNGNTGGFFITNIVRSNSPNVNVKLNKATAITCTDINGNVRVGTVWWCQGGCAVSMVITCA